MAARPILIGRRPVTCVSAVVNVYNEEPAFVLEALDSLRAQTRPVDEIIVVEDGGPRAYADLLALHKDVRHVRQANGGLAAARNTGLAEASGDFVLFLDGDDRLRPRAVELNLQQLAAHPTAPMAYGGWRYIDVEGRPQPPANMAPMGDDSYATFLQGNCIGMHATVLYRREALAEAGGFNEAFRACEDYELYLRLARLGSIPSRSEVVAEYRLHGANMSADHGMMLSTVLRVLSQEAAYASQRPEWAAAQRQGLAEWRAHYARQQYVDILKLLGGAPGRRRVLWRTARMVRAMPLVMGRVMVTELIARLRAAFRFAAGVPGVGQVDFGQLRRTTPVSRWFGYDRGRPVDRRYIEQFLEQNAADIRGRVLEVGDNSYTRRFGGDRVSQSEVLHIDRAARDVTYVADLADGEGLPDATFDCVILAQTLHFIFDMPAALRTLERILKPGGVLLLTTPGVSSVDHGESGADWLWSLTTASLDRLLEGVFRREDIDMQTHGNVLVATAFLHGLADSELTDEEFAQTDPHYPVIITARVRKAG